MVPLCLYTCAVCGSSRTSDSHLFNNGRVLYQRNFYLCDSMYMSTMTWGDLQPGLEAFRLPHFQNTSWYIQKHTHTHVYVSQRKTWEPWLSCLQQITASPLFFFLALKLNYLQVKSQDRWKNIWQQSFPACRLTPGLNLTWRVGGIKRTSVSCKKASG